jgi:hypothetical protein
VSVSPRQLELLEVRYPTPCDVPNAVLRGAEDVDLAKRGQDRGRVQLKIQITV